MLRLCWLLIKLCGWLLVTAVTGVRGVAACYIYVLFNADYTTTAGRAAVFFIFALSAPTDGIDGRLARWFGVESTFGETLDPLVDKMLNWSVLYIIWELCDIVPGRAILLGVPYIIIAGYDLSTLALRVLKSCCGYKELRMKTSIIAKRRTVFFQLTLGACLLFEAVRPWLGPAVEIVALLGLFFSGVRVMQYTYLSGREYLLTVRPWELVWSSSRIRA